jgi:hypothetical protein
MFITWCIENDLLSEEQKEDCDDDIQKIKNHKMTGGEFLIKNFDEKFTDEDLCELGNNFAEDYYTDDTKFTKKFNSYGDDFCETFDKKAVTIQSWQERANFPGLSSRLCDNPTN